MKLLIITQAVDTQDTTLGFFHRWIEEFSKRVEKAEVITLREGEHHVPANVSVYSLYKERGASRASIISRFLKLIWKLRHDYDAVFVHMNQEYVLLGGPIWKLLGKKIFFWRNHAHGDARTDIAVNFSDVLFYTSDSSFTARFKKAEKMPAGIDTQIFVRDSSISREKNSLLMFGRIAPVKKIEMAIDALASLTAKNIPATLSIIGDALPKDAGYLETLKDRSEAAGLSHLIRFEKGVRFENAPAVYARHDIFLNFTPSGSFDKTVIEALACGMKVLAANESMKSILPEGSFESGDSEDIAKKIERFISFDEKQSSEYAESAKETVNRQSLQALMDKLIECIFQKTDKKR